MATGTEHVTSQILDYVLTHSSPPDRLLSDLRAETARRFPDRVTLQIGAEQGTFMTLLSQLAAPRRAVEVGTFTGYSAICLARGLAPGGRLLCCDVNTEWTALAREYWDKAGLGGQIELRLGPPTRCVRCPRTSRSTWPSSTRTGRLPGYWAEIVPRTRSGGSSWWTTRSCTAGSSARPGPGRPGRPRLQ